MGVIKTHVGEIKSNYAKFDLALICEEKYKSLKHIDMVTYTMLKNQESLSINSVKMGNKRYVDKNGYVFIEISQIKLAKILNTTRPTLKASLDRLQACELVEVIQLGNNKCNRIYVGTAESTTTLGDYIKNIGIELDEELEEFEPKINVVSVGDIKKDLSDNTDKSDNDINNTCKDDIIKKSKKSTENNWNKNNNGNKFRNFEETFDNYSEDELERMIERNQRDKLRS